KNRLSFTCLVFFTFNTLLSLEAVRGSVAVLECEITGSAPLEVSWKKNKKRLTGDKKHRIVSQGALASLEIQSFESADAGEYECTVSNEVEPPMFSKRIESTTAVLGNAVKLQGTLKGSAPIIVKWMKDSELLRDDDSNIKMTFENNVASISFSSIELKHGGKYTCVAENEAGQQKCEAVLSIQVLARNTSSLTHIQPNPPQFLNSLTCFPTQIELWMPASVVMLRWNADSLGHSRLLSRGTKTTKKSAVTTDTRLISVRVEPLSP
uniref:Ig-like domain-containing protein n=1 Tax=Salarias fasciatus TaxID=181472 RepID=A0A672GFR8_SALFA